ncbi:MAG: amino acid permease [Candidatus Dormibacter sp.]
MPESGVITPGTPAPDRSTQDAADARDLAGFGYKQELKRILGVYSSFAVAFSYISPSTGIFTLYALGLGVGGAFFIWSWPIVALGQFLVALNFAEVSSHFPVAGSVYQWSKYLSNRHYSWFTGWIYLFAGVLTVTAVDVTVPLVLIPFLNGLGLNIPTGSASGALEAQVIVAVIVLLSTTLLNIFGVRLVAIVNNTGVVFELVGMVLFALVLLIFFHHQSPGIVFDTSSLGSGFSATTGTFLAAMFMSLFVIYGFDTASTLAEETRNPRREAPKAVLASIAGAFVIGAIFLYSTILAIPGDAHKFIADTAGAKAFPPVDIITGNFGVGSIGAELYLLVVFAAIYVCCLAIQTSTIRLAFGMARDVKLPFGAIYNRVSPTLHTPVGTCLVIGALSAIPLFYYTGAGLVAIAATGMIYLSYLLGNVAILIARTKGWPTEAAPFKLSRWGLIINVLALVWGGSMLLNFLWPRPASNPNIGSLPNFPDFLSGLGWVPVFEATLGIVLIVGAIYYLVAQRGKSDRLAQVA